METIQALNPNHNRNLLMEYCEQHDWRSAVIRLSKHEGTGEALEKSEDEHRTALHIACSNNANPGTVGLLYDANPAALSMLDAIGMTPLHCACGTHYPSVAVIKVLLQFDLNDTLNAKASKLCLMQDVDGDTPLHAACRAGASVNVIRVLLKACPEALLVRDREELTPLHRMWTRFLALQDKDVSPSYFSGRIFRDTWKCVVLFLRTFSKLRGGSLEEGDDEDFNLIHAAVSSDCPRDVLRIAICLQQHYSKHHLLWCDIWGQNALDVAIALPTNNTIIGQGASNPFICMLPYVSAGAAQHLSGVGHNFEASSTIEVLLGADRDGQLYQTCKSADKRQGTTPIHRALRFGKHWNDGVAVMAKADPEAAVKQEKLTGLQPFMLAACHAQPDGDCGKGETCLTTIFELLRRAPEQIKQASGCLEKEGCTRSPSKRALVHECLVVSLSPRTRPYKRQRTAFRA